MDFDLTIWVITHIINLADWCQATLLLQKPSLDLITPNIRIFNIHLLSKVFESCIGPVSEPFRLNLLEPFSVRLSYESFDWDGVCCERWITCLLGNEIPYSYWQWWICRLSTLTSFSRPSFYFRSLSHCFEVVPVLLERLLQVCGSYRPLNFACFFEVRRASKVCFWVSFSSLCTSYHLIPPSASWTGSIICTAVIHILSYGFASQLQQGCTNTLHTIHSMKTRRSINK